MPPMVRPGGGRWSGRGRCRRRAGWSGVGLGEGLEEALDGFGGHAHTRVADGETQPAAGVAGGEGEGFAGQADGPLAGKFDGIAEQVGKYLVHRVGSPRPGSRAAGAKSAWKRLPWPAASSP